MFYVAANGVDMGWLMGLEPTTTRITIWADNQALARLGGASVGI